MKSPALLHHHRRPALPGWLHLRLFFLFLIPILTQPIGFSDSENQAHLEWHDPNGSSFEIRGLPFHAENQGQWIRFPLRAKEIVPQAVWNNAVCPSGGRIRFQSDTSSLGLKVNYNSLPGMRNMHAFGQAGIDVYVDGQYLRSLAPRGSTETEGFLFQGLPKTMRQITLYLPLYMGLDVRRIGLDPDAVIQSATDYRLPHPVVFYGTSITMGGCASRPGMSYQAILERRLGIDFVNFGFSGAGKGERAVAEVVRQVTASCYVLGMGQNNSSIEDFENHFSPFIQTLRETRPTTPILCITPIYMTTEHPDASTETMLEGIRTVIRQTVQTRRNTGDRHIHLVEGDTMLGPGQGDGLVDGVHPNDLGFQWMADGIEPHLRAILELE